MILLWLILWFWYGWFFVLWLCHRNLMFSATPTTTIPKAHLRSWVALCFFSWLFVSACVGPPPPRVRRSTGNPQQRTNTEPGSPRSSRILNPGIWTEVILSHKHRKIKSYISVSVIRVWLALSPLGHVGSFWEVLAHRSEKPFLGSLGTSLWEAWEGEKAAGQLTRMSFILILGLSCPFSEQNGAKWYWNLTSEWLTASD